VTEVERQSAQTITDEFLPGPEMADSSLDILTRLNSQDLLEGLGLGRVRRARRLLDWLCRPAARSLAREVLMYDHLVGQHGLQEGAVLALKRSVARVEAAGQEQVPMEGPLLIVANHPGLSDSLALLATIPRTDLRIVAADWPFFRALPQTSRRLIYLPPRADGRRAVIRQVVACLRGGGSVLAFPRGELEPDPALFPGAVESLHQWSESIGLFVRLAPEARIVPAIVSGVLSASAQCHLITRLRRRPEGRKRLGEILQIFSPMYRGVTVRVAYGPCLLAADLLAVSTHAPTLAGIVIGEACRLMQRLPSKWHTVLIGAGRREMTSCSASTLPAFRVGV